MVPDPSGTFTDDLMARTAPALYTRPMGAHAELAVLSRHVARLKSENRALKAFGLLAYLLTAVAWAILMLQAVRALR
jgi:hypothetical protein